MKVEIDRKTFRRFLLLLLDDPNGINVDAFESLGSTLRDTGNDDIERQVDHCNGRVYLGEDWVGEKLRELDGE